MLGEKSTWDGCEQRQTKMLSIERNAHISPENAASRSPHIFSFRAVAKLPTNQVRQRILPHLSVHCIHGLAVGDADEG